MSKQCVKIRSGTIINNVGGTTQLPEGEYLVKINKKISDYETGKKYQGFLIDEKQIELSRLLGLSKFNAEYYKRNYPDQPHLAEKAEKAEKEFNPSVVYFLYSDILSIAFEENNL